MATKFEVTPQRVKDMLKRFAEYGVTKEQLEARVQCHIDAIRPAQLASLGKIYNSLKDGMSKASDWFDVADAAGEESRQSAKDALKERLKSAGDKTPTPIQSDATQGNDEASASKSDGELDAEDVI